MDEIVYKAFVHRMIAYMSNVCHWARCNGTCAFDPSERQYCELRSRDHKCMDPRNPVNQDPADWVYEEL